MPLHTTENIVTQFEELSNFEIIVLTNDFSAFLDKRPSLIDVVWLINDVKRGCLSTVSNILGIEYFCWINILKFLLTSQQLIDVVFFFKWLLLSDPHLHPRHSLISYIVRKYTYIKPWKWVYVPSEDVSSQMQSPL